ncbi:MAG: TlpA family protein disulfide reductase [Myxococcota bacterium]
MLTLLALAHAAPLGAGDPAPEFTVATLDGGTLSASALRGEVVVLNFWATWCAPCLDELPRLDELGARLQGSGARLVTVNIDKAQGPVVGTVRRLGLDAPVGLDPSALVVSRFAPPVMPTTYVLDRTGSIHGVWAHVLSAGDVAALEREVRTLAEAR